MSVIIPTHERPDALAATLRHLAEVRDPAPDEIVVVDDGNDPATRHVIDATDGLPPVRLLSQDHLGVATARNRGASAAIGDLLVFLDDDMLVEPDHLRRHLDVQAAHGPCWTNGHWEFADALRADLSATPFGRFRLGVETWVKTGVELRPLDDGTFEPTGVTAANLGVPPQLFWEVDGFDESFPHAGCEDQDLSLRAARAGHRFVYAPEIRLAHDDQRDNLRDFGDRQRRGALTAVHLVAKEPGLAAERPFVMENLPMRLGQPWRVLAKKAAKALLARPLVLRSVLAGISRWERTQPDSRLLARAYWSVLGVYIFQGVRQGLARHPGLAEVLLAA